MNPNVIGLTGGIGAGKSTVSALFAEHGIAIIDTDLIAHELTAKDGEAIPALRVLFDEHSFLADGSLDRAYVRQCIYANSTKKRQLESILHPLILKKSVAKLKEVVPIAPYALLVVPLLCEHYAIYGQFVHRILLIDCEESLQIERAYTRGCYTRSLIRTVLASQCTRQQRVQLADDVIVNNKDKAYLAKQVEAKHQFYIHHFATTPVLLSLG